MTIKPARSRWTQSAPRQRRPCIRRLDKTRKPPLTGESLRTSNLGAGDGDETGRLRQGFGAFRRNSDPAAPKGAASRKSGHSSTAWRKGSNQPFAAALKELGARLLQPVRGDCLSLFRGLAIGAPASIAASCRIAASRYRRVSANRSTGSMRVLRCFDSRKEISFWHSGAVRP
jgi:hypothetical protein